MSKRGIILISALISLLMSLVYSFLESSRRICILTFGDFKREVNIGAVQTIEYYPEDHVVSGQLRIAGRTDEYVTHPTQAEESALSATLNRLQPDPPKLTARVAHRHWYDPGYP